MPIPVLGLVLSLTGCGNPSLQADRETASRPAPLPAFIYPSEAPVVDVEELSRYLVGLQARNLIVWVGSDYSTLSRQMAGSLAELRDELRAKNCWILAIYLGTPVDWATRLVPMLRSAGANFPCSVADPADRIAMGAWLSGVTDGLKPGLYLLSPSGRVLRRATPQDDALRELVSSLRANGSPTRSEARAARYFAEVRVIRLSDGSRCRPARADGATIEAVAELLACQLMARPDAIRGLAILPIRCAASPSSRPGPINTPGRESADPGMLLAEALGQRLATVPAVQAVPVGTARDILARSGQGTFAAEFDPGSLQRKTGWAAVLVGVLTRPASSDPNGTAR